MFFFSAPADASTDDAAAHATGNGVASEVCSLHTVSIIFVCFYYKLISNSMNVSCVVFTSGFSGHR